MIRTVGELIEALEGFDPSIPLALKVVGRDGETAEGVTARRVSAAGIPLDVEIEDVYYPDAKTVQGSDVVVCLTNSSAADMKMMREKHGQKKVELFSFTPLQAETDYGKLCAEAPRGDSQQTTDNGDRQ